MNRSELKSFLDEKVQQYNNFNFIDSDPILIPHLYNIKEDIEIAGFLAATIAWGNRKSIITNAHKMMALMGNAPHDFIMNHKPKDLHRLEGFVHRTFNATDFEVFIKSLQYLYQFHGGLEQAFAKSIIDNNLQLGISNFKKLFFEKTTSVRTFKHISDPAKNSAAKRLNMYLRWMCRQDKAGVDLGIWTSISPSLLSCPLDVHSGNVARKLKLLNRSQNDGKAVAELDASLRQMDKTDPAKYDFALFGLGVFEGF